MLHMRIYLTLIACLIAGSVASQEILTGLEYNPVVQAKALEVRQNIDLKSGADTIPITLPFFDDFRAATVFPSTDRWIDRFAFVNNSYPLYPINTGVATMDAINDTGRMYPTAVQGPEAFIADYLTSRYIRLDSLFSPVPRKLTPADSVWMSFWYQPQGRGKAPQTGDSLVLQFLIEPAHDSIAPDTVITIPDLWETIWSTRGMPLDTFYLNNHSYFKQVMIPVTDAEKFFKPTFRFRFYNYVSLAGEGEPSWQGNCDQWNIDEVRLDCDRTWHDTIRPELTFIESVPSLLQQYTAMPYTQYCDNPTNEIKDTLDMLMANRDVVVHTASYKYTLTGQGGAFNKTYDGGLEDLNSFFTSNYVDYIPFAHPPVQYLLPISSSDTASFLVTHMLTATDGSGLGDTIQAWQHFYNYYAYDDGSPEAGYGLTPTGSLLAYRFTINKADTLRGVQIYFNRTLTNANDQNFYLRVWNDNNGKPGTIIADSLCYVQFSDSLNQPVSYYLSPAVKVSGTFYVGMEQTTDDNLNIGFDRNDNHQKQILYNVGGDWYSSVYSGSLMIRPLIGKRIPLGIPGTGQPSEVIRIYPNPVTGGSFHVTIPGTVINPGEYTAIITDLSGRIICTTDAGASGIISSEGLSSGMYLLSLKGKNGVFAGHCPFVVTH